MDLARFLSGAAGKLAAVAAVCLCLCQPLPASAGGGATIGTLAGRCGPGFEAGGFEGDGGPAKDALLSNPKGMAVYGSGLYFIDYGNRRVRKISMDTDPPVISTVAGGGDGTFTEGMQAREVRLSLPEAIAVDAHGNIYIAEAGAKVVLRVDAKDGGVSRVAGNYSRWQVKEGARAVSSSLRNPVGIAVDGAGNLYIADEHGHCIRKVDATTGTMTTVAGNGSPYGPFKDKYPAAKTSVPFPKGVAVDPEGSIYLLDVAGSRVRVRKVDKGTGLISTLGSVRQEANSISWDGRDGLLITGGNRVYRVDAGTGRTETVAGTGARGCSGDGGPAVGASLDEPHGAATDGSGSLYISDTGNNRIRKVVLGQ